MLRPDACVRHRAMQVAARKTSPAPSPENSDPMSWKAFLLIGAPPGTDIKRFPQLNEHHVDAYVRCRHWQASMTS